MIPWCSLMLSYVRSSTATVRSETSRRHATCHFTCTWWILNVHVIDRDSAVFFLILPPTTIMFKGLIPSSKRISSSEFTMITPLGDSAINGKENQPEPTLDSHKATKPVLNKAKPFVLNPDRKKNAQTKTMQHLVEGVMMDQAFDKLLVRGFGQHLFLILSLCPILGRASNSIESASQTCDHGLCSKGSHAQVITGHGHQPSYDAIAYTSHCATSPDSQQ